MGDAIVIRAARPGEYDSLDRLAREASFALPEYRDRLIANPEFIRIYPELLDSGQALVAVRDDRIAGFTAWNPIGELTAELYGVFVDPILWRSGIGMPLIKAVEQVVTQRGFTQLYVVAPAGTEEFYRRTGFVRTGVTATPFGPAVTMLMEIQE